MKPFHGVGLLLLLFVVYLVGVKFPGVGASLLGKVGM